MPVYEGIITKGIGGFYYVDAAGKNYECKAKGIFRKNKIKPLAGDRVKISVNENAENTIDEIFKRKSELSRPPVANIDKLFVISSTVEPAPVLLNIDRLCVTAINKNIEPIIVFTKCDLAEDIYSQNYFNSGIKSYSVSVKNNMGIDNIVKELSGCISAFAGNSGVGKSTLLNCIFPDLKLKTNEISYKLGRGKHTTRECELFKTENGYVADTPGFSSFDLDNIDVINKDDLPFCFPEFEKYLGLCKYSTCRHINDQGCKIVKAVEEGYISKSRHENYCIMMEQSLAIKEWEIKG